ncbi:MAG: hypothetical protein MEQ74_01725 [Paracoccus sp.]|nr:hypothetical protein [Paracoccus sp. (in: a-proteobacteria)]
MVQEGDQENDPGNMPAFMITVLWKSVFQFRSFMLASYSKQLLSGIHHRDSETLSAFSTSMFFTTLFYAGQTVVNAQGRADKEEFLEKRVSPESLAKASFQRAGSIHSFRWGSIPSQEWPVSACFRPPVT